MNVFSLNNISCNQGGTSGKEMFCTIQYLRDASLQFTNPEYLYTLMKYLWKCAIAKRFLGISDADYFVSQD